VDPQVCLLRLQRDLADLDGSDPTYKLMIPDPTDLQHFTVTITPLQGMYRDGKYKFNFTIPDDWPNVAPVVRVATRVWHPNIQELPEDGVCLKIFREAFSPILTIYDFILGLVILFTDPNPDDSLNVDAGKQFRVHPEEFRLKVEEYRNQYAQD
jgi:ubiquitin-protein ligase